MLTPWLELPGAEDRARWMSVLTGLDLIRLGTTADADEIRDTAVTQPLIVCLSLIAAAELTPAGSQPGPQGGLQGVAVTAGHSVGELAAAAVAGALHPDTAVAFTGLRGRAMAEACGMAETSMSAVLGGDPDEVIARIEELKLTPANRNGAGQVVAAGAVDALAALAEAPPAKARVVPLSVAGAFHTPYMEPAEAQLSGVLSALGPRDPAITLLSNLDGTAVDSGQELVRRLVQQVTAPVRWDLCMQTMLDLGVTEVIELPPAGTLAGLAKRGMKGVEILALKGPEDLDAARAMIARNGSQ